MFRKGDDDWGLYIGVTGKGVSAQKSESGKEHFLLGCAPRDNVLLSPRLQEEKRPVPSKDLCQFYPVSA